MPSSSLNKALKRTAALALVAVAVIFSISTLRGPHGIPALIERRREIRELQEKNADLVREIQHKRDRLRRLRESQVEQEMEIRQRLKLLRPGETTFILPEAKPQ